LLLVPPLQTKERA